MKTVVKNDMLLKEYTVYTHPSGLKTYVYKMPGFSSFYAVFGTKYGSIDNVFSVRGEKTEVPAGIAHFLEHKMFECEDGDAFMKFSKTGAYSNAYTSFDKTCYLFSCSKMFYENLDILLDFVTHPYFTEQTVKKEQGIIGQEITMYDDMPSWRVFHNLLGCLYEKHPVRIDIPGTRQSISEITPSLLYDCHSTFYRPSNMFLAVCGDVDEQRVFEAVDKCIKTDYLDPPSAIFPEEGLKSYKKSATQQMDVGKPLFALGFKDSSEKKPLLDLLATDLLLRIIAGDASPLYKRLLEQELIDEDFGSEYMCGRGFAAAIFEGAGEQPGAVAEAIMAEISRIKKEGIDPVLFEAVRRGALGSALKQLNSAESVGTALTECAVRDEGLFLQFDLLRTIKPEDLLPRLSLFSEDRCALSVINGK